MEESNVASIRLFFYASHLFLIGAWLFKCFKINGTGSWGGVGDLSRGCDGAV